MAECLTERYSEQIKGVLHSFDRIVVFGSFDEIKYSGAMDWHLKQKGVRLVDYEKKYATKLRQYIKDQVKAVSSYYGKEIEFVNQHVRKEDYVAKKLEDRGRRPGLVCVLSAMESCRAYKIRKDKKSGFLCVKNCPGKCLHYYIYFIDEELGLGYLRIPTWAPFRMQLYFNGHDWLERQMKKEGIRYKKVDNAFTHIFDFKRANEIAANLDPERLQRVFNKIAERWVGVYDYFHGQISWSVFQAELATDIVFKNDQVLPQMYEEITRTALCEFKCPDVYQFLGKRLCKTSKQFAESRLQTYAEGTRLKHSIKSNSIKMYDKQDRVLRIETTTSDVSSFQCYRRVASRDGSRDPRRASVRKALSCLDTVFKVLLACNKRYLSAISQMQDRTNERHRLSTVVESKKDSKGRSCRGVNFFKKDDLLFLNAILQGQHHIMGMRNQSLQYLLPNWNAQKIGRNLRRFRELGILKKVAGTTKYYTTKLGKDVLSAALQLKERIVLPEFKTI